MIVLLPCVRKGPPIELLLLVDEEYLVLFSGQKLCQLGNSVLSLAQGHILMKVAQLVRLCQKILQASLARFSVLGYEHRLGAQIRGVETALNALLSLASMSENTNTNVKHHL